jgi:hypothetical protein
MRQRSHQAAPRDDSLICTDYKMCYLPVITVTANAVNSRLDFLWKVLRGRGIFLAFLSASGTCARRAMRRIRSGAAGWRRSGLPRGLAAGMPWHLRVGTWHQAGMAERRDCLVATPHWGA